MGGTGPEPALNHAAGAPRVRTGDRTGRTLSHLVTNLVGGTAPASGDAFVAEWPLLVIGARPQLGVTIRRIDARLAEDFGVEIVCWQRADVALIDAKAFAVCAGITSGAALMEFEEVPEGSAESAVAAEVPKPAAKPGEP